MNSNYKFELAKFKFDIDVFTHF